LPFATQQDEFSPAVGVSAIALTNSLLRFDLVLDGAVSTSGNELAWALGRNVFAYLAQLSAGMTSLADAGEFIRARVTLKGRAIRDAAGALFLDGQAFGAPATRRDGATPRIDLTLPSGNSEKASDFESWFYVAPIQQIETMTITPAQVAFVFVPGTRLIRLVDNTSGQPNPAGAAVAPTLTLTLNYNSLADTTVALSVSGGTTGIVTVANSVTLPRGSDSPAQPVPLTVRNPGPVTQTYTITGTLTLPSGQQVNASATITVTGVTPPGPVLTPGPILNPGPIGSPVLNIGTAAPGLAIGAPATNTAGSTRSEG
jgi:hypothetical protein